MLYLINYAGKAGTERYVEALASSLDVTAYFAYNEDGLLRQRMEDLSVPVWRLEMKSRFDFRAALRVARFCRKNGIDVIHTNFLRENYIALLSRLFYPRTRVVYTNHIILVNDFITRLSNRFLSALQHRVIAVCAPGKARLISNGIPAKIIEVIHNGIDPKLWSCERHRKDGPATFIYAARVVADKGHDILLNAAALIKDKPFKIIIAGDGDLLDSIRALAERLELDDRVVFTGFCQDVRPLLAEADVFVSPSLREALSISLLEAMAAGLPLIAADTGGNPEILAEGGGIMVPCGDENALAAAMVRMLEEPELREKCGQASLAAANGKFNVSTMLSKTKATYM